MCLMDNVAKEKPKVLTPDIRHDQLMQYDPFFFEINITEIECRSTKPYLFGQVSKRNNKGFKNI